MIFLDMHPPTSSMRFSFSIFLSSFKVFYKVVIAQHAGDIKTNQRECLGLSDYNE
jgi:hypothetical protein